MTFDEVVEDLSRRAGSTVAIDIRPVGSPKDVFSVQDGIDRVWFDDNGTAYLVLHEVDIAFSFSGQTAFDREPA